MAGLAAIGLGRASLAVAGIVASASLFAAGDASAQMSAEVRFGLTYADHSAAQAGLDLLPQPSFEAGVRRQVRPGLAVTAGFAHTPFGCDDESCHGRPRSVRGNHASVGVEGSWRWFWVRAGALAGFVRVGSDDSSSSKFGLGLQAGGGVRFDFGRLQLAPGFTYRRFAAGTREEPGHVTAIGFDLGVGFRIN